MDVTIPQRVDVNVVVIVVVVMDEKTVFVLSGWDMWNSSRVVWEKTGGMVVVDGQVTSKVLGDDGVGNGREPFL